MSASHEKKHALAQRLIAKHGRKITLVATGAPNDPTKPWEGGGDDVLFPNIMSCFVPFQGSGFGETIETASLLTGANEVCLIAPDASIDIASINYIEDGGIRYGIEWREVLKPGDVRIIIGLGVNR